MLDFTEKEYQESLIKIANLYKKECSYFQSHINYYNNYYNNVNDDDWNMYNITKGLIVILFMKEFNIYDYFETPGISKSYDQIQAFLKEYSSLEEDQELEFKK